MKEELKKRKDPRLKDFDYKTLGGYFITICTQGKKCILSKIEDTKIAERDKYSVGEGFPLPQLSNYGEIAEDQIKEIPQKYPSVWIDQYVIMPNHIHLLLILTANEDGRGDPSPTVSDVVGWFKYNTSKKINALRNTPGEKIFQRSFYDHVIRNHTDYDEIAKYIVNNPKAWFYDKLYTE